MGHKFCTLLGSLPRLTSGGSSILEMASTYYATSEDVVMGIIDLLINENTCTQLSASISRPTDDEPVKLG